MVFLILGLFSIIILLGFLYYKEKRKSNPSSIQHSTRSVAAPSISTIFDNSFEAFYEILKGKKESLPPDTYRDMESFSFLYTVATYFIAQLRDPLRENAMNELHSFIKKAYPLYINRFFEQRNEFYCNFIGSKMPKAIWYSDSIPDVPEIKMYLAFGDILFDPSLRSNYDDSGMPIVSIFSQVESLKAFNSLQEPYFLYCRALKHIVDNQPGTV